MSTEWLGLIMDGVVAVLLLAAIPSFLVLSRRLKTMQDGQDGMRKLIEGLNVATEQARRSVADLKLAAANAGQELEAQLKTARQMADELALMVDAGDNLANRLENVISQGRITPPPQAKTYADVLDDPEDDYAPPPAREDAPQAARGPLSRTEAERDLLKALKTIR